MVFLRTRLQIESFPLSSSIYLYPRSKQQMGDSISVAQTVKKNPLPSTFCLLNSNWICTLVVDLHSMAEIKTIDLYFKKNTDLQTLKMRIKILAFSENRKPSKTEEKKPKEGAEEAKTEEKSEPESLLSEFSEESLCFCSEFDSSLSERVFEIAHKEISGNSSVTPDGSARDTLSIPVKCTSRYVLVQITFQNTYQSLSLKPKDVEQCIKNGILVEVFGRKIEEDSGIQIPSFKKLLYEVSANSSRSDLKISQSSTYDRKLDYANNKIIFSMKRQDHKPSKDENATKAAQATKETTIE